MSSTTADSVLAKIEAMSVGTQVTGSGATTAAAPPAGGTGAAAGAYDTAGNRDAMISAQNNLRIDHEATKVALDNLITVLRANKVVP